MGLLDWLTEAVAPSTMGGGPGGMRPPMMGPVPEPMMPPPRPPMMPPMPPGPPPMMPADDIAAAYGGGPPGAPPPRPPQIAPPPLSDGPQAPPVGLSPPPGQPPMPPPQQPPIEPNPMDMGIDPSMVPPLTPPGPPPPVQPPMSPPAVMPPVIQPPPPVPPPAPVMAPPPPPPPPPIGPAPPPVTAPPVAGRDGMPPPRPVPPAAAPPPPPPPLEARQLPVTRNQPPPAAGGESGGMGSSLLGRAFGLNPRDDRTVRGSLAAGLKSVGDNVHKPGLAAFSGSAGSAMEGGEKTVNRDYDERLKALNAAITAKRAGDNAAYQTNYLKYQMSSTADKLELDKSKQADRRVMHKDRNDAYRERTASRTGGVGGRGAAWNKPDSQKYLDIQNAVAKDPEIKTLAKAADKINPIAFPKEAAEARAALQARMEERKAEHMKVLGLDPKKMADMAANPPGSEKNPHDLKGIRPEEFYIYVKPGDRYINPDDGKVYIAKPKAADSASRAPAPPAIPPAPLPPASDDGDDDDDDTE